MGREVNELDWTLELEGPQNYRGYRLSPDKRAQLTQVLYSTLFEYFAVKLHYFYRKRVMKSPYFKSCSLLNVLLYYFLALLYAGLC